MRKKYLFGLVLLLSILAVGFASAAQTLTYTTPTETNNSVIDRSYIRVNVSVAGDPFANLTIRLYNSSGLQASNFSTSNITNMNFSGLADGVYRFNVTSLNTTGGAYNSLTYVVTLDTSAPVVTVTSPTSGTYTQGNVLFSFSASDAVNVSALWYNDGSGNTSYTDAFYQDLDAGSYAYTFFANDSLNHVGSTSVSFTVNDNFGTGGCTGSEHSIWLILGIVVLAGLMLYMLSLTEIHIGVQALIALTIIIILVGNLITILGASC